MKFVLEVDVDEGEDKVKELERILRYWGGNLRHYTLEPDVSAAIYDSAYREVGKWQIADSA